MRAPRLPHHRRRDHLRRHGHRARSAPERAPQAARPRGSPMSRRAPRPPSIPAHTLMDQVCRGAVRHGIMRTRRGASARRQPVQAARPAEARRRSASAIPHQVSGGQLQRAMTAMAMVCRARPHRLRRADHGARRDDADRGAGRDHATLIREHRHGGALHHPRPRRRRPDRRPRSWCCATARWSNSATPGRSC